MLSIFSVKINRFFLWHKQIVLVSLLKKSDCFSLDENINMHDDI